MTAFLAIFLVVSYFTVGAYDDPRPQIMKNAQEQRLFDVPLAAALYACAKSPEETYCKNSQSHLLELQKKAANEENFDVEEGLTIFDAEQFFMAWWKAHPDDKPPMAGAFLKDADRFYKVILNTSVQTDNSISGKTVSARTLVLSQISHAGYSHLFNNIFALVLFGSLVEGWLGSALYFFIYALSGTLGMLFYVKLFAAPDVHVLGASGNISAIVAAYGIYMVKFRREKLQTSRGAFAYGLYILYFLFGSDVLGIAQGRGGVAFGVHLLSAFIGAFILLIAGIPSASGEPRPYLSKNVEAKNIEAA